MIFSLGVELANALPNAQIVITFVKTRLSKPIALYQDKNYFSHLS